MGNDVDKSIQLNRLIEKEVEKSNKIYGTYTSQIMCYSKMFELFGEFWKKIRGKNELELLNSGLELYSISFKFILDTISEDLIKSNTYKFDEFIPLKIDKNKCVNKLINNEMLDSVDLKGRFHKCFEGYGVIKEEIEELNEGIMSADSINVLEESVQVCSSIYLFLHDCINDSTIYNRYKVDFP